MSVRRIVFSFDGSETSLKALPWAIRFAKESGAATVLLSVFEPLAQYPIGKAANLLQFEMSAKQYLEDLQNEAKEAFLKEGLTIETVLLDGNPADEIISYAAANPIDLILCGTRGLGEIGSLLLGSVAQKLVTYSQVPVLVIK